MADVFISYAKADRPLALKLAAMLEAEGWKVWWDTSLTIGEDFRNEIMTELGRARAVIVIWTDASIMSDWVRSEAGRAQANRKLIPVKLPHLVYEDLPPPFDVLHTKWAYSCSGLEFKRISGRSDPLKSCADSFSAIV